METRRNTASGSTGQIPATDVPGLEDNGDGEGDKRLPGEVLSEASLCFHDIPREPCG